MEEFDFHSSDEDEYEAHEPTYFFNDDIGTENNNGYVRCPKYHLLRFRIFPEKHKKEARSTNVFLLSQRRIFQETFFWKYFVKKKKK